MSALGRAIKASGVEQASKRVNGKANCPEYYAISYTSIQRALILRFIHRQFNGTHYLRQEKFHAFGRFTRKVDRSAIRVSFLDAPLHF